MRLLGTLLVFSAFLLTGCPGPTKAYIPVDSPLRTWEPPESDEYMAEPPPPPPAPEPAAATPPVEAAPAAAAAPAPVEKAPAKPKKK